jgi:hypothetical protein
MLKEAAGEFEKTISLNPRHGLASYRLSEIRRQMGEK